MSFSFTAHTGDGETVTFPFSFTGQDDGYLREDDISVEVDGVSQSFSLTGTNQVTMENAPTDGASIRILRNMPADVPYTDFQRGNKFGAQNVNNSFLQQLYLLHELLDGFKPDGYYEKQNLSLGSNRITDLAYGVNDNDAVSLAQVIDLGVGGEPAAGVISVNGESGIVVLTQDDIEDGSSFVQTANNYDSTAKIKVDHISIANNIDLDVLAATVEDLEEGGVSSVNTQTGAVVLTQDDILDGTTHVQTANDYDDTDKTKMDYISVATPSDLDDMKADIAALESGGVTSVNGEVGVVVLTQDDILDGTSHVQTANDFTNVYKATVDLNATHRTTVTGNPHSVTKAEVGLTNVPDTDCTNASNINSGTLNKERLPDIIEAKTISIDNSAGTYRLIEFLSDNLDRWKIGTNNTAESGSNSGSHFALYRYDDAGTILAQSLTIKRDTGLFIFEGSDWDGSHIQLGNYHFWVDASNSLRIKSSIPTFDTDGAVVGADDALVSLNTVHRETVTGNPHNVTKEDLGIGEVTLTAANYTGLKAINISSMNDNTQVFVAGRANPGDEGGGSFYWSSSDESTNVTNDPQKGIYVAPTSDLTGASGAWIRIYYQVLNAAWFGLGNDVAVHTAFDAFVDAIQSIGIKGFVPAGNYYLETGIAPTVVSDIDIEFSNNAKFTAASTIADKMFNFDKIAGNHYSLRLKGGFFNNSAIPTSASAWDAIYISGRFDKVIIEDVEIYQGARYDTSIGNTALFISADNFIVKDCTFTGVSDSAIYISNDATLENGINAVIENCYFDKCTTGIVAKRVFKRLNVSNNFFNKCEVCIATAEADGIRLPGVQNIIANNQIVQPITGIQIRIATGSIVSNNHIIDIGYDLDDTVVTYAKGINVQGSEGCIIQGNLIEMRDYSTGGVNHIGINLERRTYNSVDYDCVKNLISNNFINGINVGIKETDSNQDNNKIVFNNVHGFTTSLLKGGGSLSFYAEYTTESSARLDVTGTLSLGGTYGKESLRVVPVNNAVNFVEVDGAVTGSEPIIGATGSDLNIDLRLTAKGTGNIRFGTHAADAGSPVTTGYITIKDHNGATRKLAVID